MDISKIEFSVHLYSSPCFRTDIFGLLYSSEERACSDSFYLFLLRKKDVNLLRLKKAILLKNTNDPNLLRLTFVHFWTLDFIWLVNNRILNIIWIRIILDLLTIRFWLVKDRILNTILWIRMIFWWFFENMDWFAFCY